MRLFSLLPISDIQRDAYVVSETSRLRITNGKSSVPYPPDRAIWPDDTVLVSEWKAVPLYRQRGQDARAVLRMNGIDKGLWLFVQTGAGSSPHTLISRADVERLADRRVGRPDDLFNCFGDLPETGFALL